MLPLYVPSVFFAISQAMLIPVLPLYANSFNVGYGVVGLVLAAEGLGTLLGDVPSGVILRRYGLKWVMAAGIMLSGVAVAALYWFGSIYFAFFALLVSGMGISAYNIARHAYLSEQVHVVRRGRAIAIFGGVGRLGSFIGPAVAGIVAKSAGLTIPFLLYLAFAVLAMICVLLYLKDHPVEIKVKHHHGGYLLKTLRENRQMLLSAGTGQLFGQMIRAARRVMVPLYGADVLGLDVAQIGLIVSAAALLDLALFYSGGWLMDNWGRKYAIIPCFTIQGIAMMLIPLTTGFGGLLAVTMLMGFGNGLGSGTMMTVGADLAPSDTRGEFLGVWRLIGDGGFTGAPLIVGGIADIVALPLAAVVMGLSGLVAAGVFAVAVPETLQKQPATPIGD